MTGLREALEASLATLPTMSYVNGYPVQALPKADLLSLLALHSAHPLDDADLVVHHHDMEATARHFNQGYAEACEQFESLLGEARVDLVVDGPARDLMGYLTDAVKAMGAGGEDLWKPTEQQVAEVLREHVWISSESKCSCGDQEIEFHSRHQAAAVLALVSGGAR